MPNTARNRPFGSYRFPDDIMLQRACAMRCKKKTDGERSMEFGIFDHLDASGRQLHDYYEDRLKLIELFDRSGFRSYHVAEHHSTPLGMAPSPTVFLSAVASRTTRLRFGPLVFALPLYHPLRLVQEICMVDQISKGRLEIGFGRGASPIEASYFGNDHAEAEQTYRDSLDLILKALETGSMDGRGTFDNHPDIPLLVECYQKPHPPLWYGVHSTESADRAARMGSNIVSLDTAEETREFADCFRGVWDELHGDAKPVPLIGLGMFIFVAEDDETALTIARRAYPVWHESFNWLFQRHNTPLPRHARPAEFDAMAAQGRAIAGSPDTVSAFLEDRLTVSSASYLVGQHVFGDLSPEEATRSVELFASDVMPILHSRFP
jgi:alkanesulfonate monooxygenase SsuD/methylene tetrahydromethanopterin reductase-like flavin-dependent oxidoreductase (luciferase family)